MAEIRIPRDCASCARRSANGFHSACSRLQRLSSNLIHSTERNPSRWAHFSSPIPRNSPFLMVFSLFVIAASAAPEPQSAIVKSEFIFEKAPFPSCHASTIAEGKEGLVSSWFGGTREKNEDVGIWSSRNESGAWTAPVEVANGVQSPEKRFPCWNPVLFQPKTGPLLLFYKVGSRPSRWLGMLIQSNDGGKHWSKPRRLPDGILGPIKNKPIQLADGDILCPSSTEDNG